MDPFTMIQAGAGLASTIGQLVGGSSADRAANVQAVMAQRQLEAQRQNAALQYQLATAGTRNARGDTTEYVPGVGWVERLSPQSAAMQGASDAETAQRYDDLGRAREGRVMNFERRLPEGAAANRLLMNFEGQQGRSPAAIEAAMIERNVAAAQDPVDATRQQVQMNALRGNSGAADVLAALSREGARGTRSGIAEARLAAPGAAEEENSARRNNTLNQYNTLATRASNIDDVPFNPENIVGTQAARGQAQANNAPGAVSGASQALYRGGSQSTQYPGSGGTDWGSALAALGQSGANLYNAFDDRQMNKKTGWQSSGGPLSGGAAYGGAGGRPY